MASVGDKPPPTSERHAVQRVVSRDEDPQSCTHCCMRAAARRPREGDAGRRSRASTSSGMDALPPRARSASSVGFMSWSKVGTAARFILTPRRRAATILSEWRAESLESAAGAVVAGACGRRVLDSGR
jgi:hypothetical protein